MASSSLPPSESLLVFSDVHLGSDLNDCTPNPRRRSRAIDRDLVDLLVHYRTQPLPADRWRVVIAGDFIDFIGMTIAPTAADESGPLTALTLEERAHGLGSAEDHARLKLARVAERHAEVFEALAGYVADGHALTLVHGNHDIEFHWDAVKADFRDELYRHASKLRAIDRAEFDERVEFRQWFYYRDGVVYIEHGHQYDPFCSTAHVMSPISPLDPRRIVAGFSDVLIRYVVRPTRGMTEHGHETFGVFDYMAFGVKLGLSGMFRLLWSFILAITELFRLRRAYLTEAAAVLRAEHEKRVLKLAEATRIGKERLFALLSLQAPPISHSIGGILSSVLLDRLALAMAATLAIVLLAIFGAFHGYAPYSAALVVVAWSLLHRHLSRRRHVDPTAILAERAWHLAKLFPAAFVVMGHTHVPTEAPAGSATYINLGSWAEEEPTEGAMHEGGRAARTHVVIHVNGARAEGHFRRWEPSEGPRDVHPGA